MSQVVRDENVKNREIAEGLYWIEESRATPRIPGDYKIDPPEWYEPGREVRVSFNAFLIAGEKTLLFDTLTPEGSEAILQQLDELLGDRPLDYIVVSHPEAPHAGNTQKIHDAYPEATIVAPKHEGFESEMYYLRDATIVETGDTIDLGGYEVEFIDGVFPDHSIHLWMHEKTTHTLFTVDWLGFLYTDDESLHYVDELERPFSPHRIKEFHARALGWLEFVDTDKTDAAIDALIEKYGDGMIAPAHGLVIRENAREVLETMKDVTAAITRDGRKRNIY